MKMHKNNKPEVVARRAWRLLRLTLLWARKGGILKNRLVLAKHLLRNIRNSTHQTQRHRAGASAIGYGERELSFDDTPVIHVRMHRPSSLRFKMPNIPCINPPVLDFDYEDAGMYNYYDNADEDEQQPQNNEEGGAVCQESPRSSTSTCEQGEIDLKAEQFIAKFYQQIKLQRQISYLQYHEMISRGAN